MHGHRFAWRLSRAGSLDRLACVEEALPAPGPGEARLEIRAIGLNFADVLACLGLYSATPKGPFVPGLEAAGVITALGPARNGAPPFQVGDRVVALTRFGGYATRLNADARFLHRVPDGWSFAQAAAFPVQALTAWYGLVHLGRVRRGEVVLVQSAAGGVGLQALAILRRVGARPVAVVGHARKIDFVVERCGVARANCMLRTTAAEATALEAMLGALGVSGFDVVFDAVLGPGFRAVFDHLAPEGRYVLYGAADFIAPGARPSWPRLAWKWLRRPRLDPLAMIAANRAVLAFNLIWLWGQPERLPGAFAALAELALEPPWIGAQHDFRAAPAALAELQSGATVGKTILYVGET